MYSYNIYIYITVYSVNLKIRFFSNLLYVHISKVIFALWCVPYIYKERGEREREWRNVFTICFSVFLIVLHLNVYSCLDNGIFRK